MKITKEVLEAHLNCKFKGHLKLVGEVGTRTDYEAMTTAARAASREQAIAKLVARSGEEATCVGTTVAVTTLRKWWAVYGSMKQTRITKLTRLQMNRIATG